MSAFNDVTIYLEREKKFMAILGSGLYVDTWMKALKNDLAIDLVDDTIKAALFVSHTSWTPNYSATSPGYGTSPYITTTNYEIPDGNGYTQGGKALTSKQLAESPAGILKWSASDIVWNASTITNAAGALLYDDTLSGNPALVFLSFGINYSTIAGDFTIFCPSTGFVAIDLVP